MTAATVPTRTLAIEGDIGVLTLSYPPVNALSQLMREAIVEGVREANANPAIKAIVLVCDGRTFLAGADITEFGKPPKAPSLREAQDQIENAGKPVIAAIHGTALGGGLEVALCCHYRVAVPSAKCGLPEVHLGLLPGAGGTQRLPRIVGVEQALDMILNGSHVPAKKCLEMGLVDALVPEGELRAGAIAFARTVLTENRPLRKVRDNDDKLIAARAHPEIFAKVRQANARKFRGFPAPEANIQCVEAAVNLSFEEGLATERRLFTELVAGTPSIAQRYAFFAERKATKIPDVPEDTPTARVAKVGIIGAGTMGGGIAMNFANAGVPVTLVETNEDALFRGLRIIRGNYETTAKKGKMKPEDVDTRMGLLTGSIAMEDLADCDLIIEAVFEQIDVKREVFAKLDRIARPGAILATNTSYLDIDDIAAATSRPDSVVGLHFFSPANVMKLLEVVRTRDTKPEIIATAMKLAKTIGKIGVLVGNGYGFVGNRILAARNTQADQLILEGATPWAVDKILYDFGFAMGHFQMRDLVGLDVGWNPKTTSSANVREILNEMGRHGQKTKGGFYDYDENRKQTPSPVAMQVIEDFAAKQGITRRDISDAEIQDRILFAMVNEGARILDEGIASRASDIDIVWITGYGWPKYRGGPMFWADLQGLPTVLDRLKALEAAHGAAFTPSPLIERLVAQGKGFKDA